MSWNLVFNIFSVYKIRNEGVTILNAYPGREIHGPWPWMNAPTLGRDVAPLGR